MTAKLSRGNSLSERSSDFYVECASEGFQGIVGVEQLGVSLDIDDTDEDVGVATFAAITAAQKVTLVSSSAADDTDSGTGTRTVRIEGLTTGFVEQTEDLALEGATPVDSAKDWLRINSVESVAAGSGGVNAGAITVTAKTDTTLQGTMIAGTGAMQTAVYTVAAGKEGFITDYYASLVSSLGGAVNGIVSLFVRKAADGATPSWVMRHTMAVVQTGSSMARHDFKPYLLVPEKSDVRLHFTTDDNNTHVVAGFNMIVA